MIGSDYKSHIVIRFLTARKWMPLISTMIWLLFMVKMLTLFKTENNNFWKGIKLYIMKQAVVSQLAEHCDNRCHHWNCSCLWEGNRRFTISDLWRFEHEYGDLCSSIRKILEEDLNFHKVHAHWVPYLLTDADYMQCMGGSSQYTEFRADLISQIMTGDETCVLHTPGTKHKRIVWKHPVKHSHKIQNCSAKHQFLTVESGTIFLHDRIGRIVAMLWQVPK